MPQQDTSGIKNKIVSIIQVRGPCLPVHIAKEIGMNILFTSAFLSELLSEKKIKISNMRIGSSKLHFISGQEPQLENFSEHLKSKERDAFELLKQKKYLKDSEVEPAIRVALRSIKDFAIPVQRNNEIIWRYFTFPESQIPKPEPPKPQQKPQSSFKEKVLNIFEKPKQKPRTKTTKKPRTSQKKNEKFFNKIKDYLSSQQIEIIGIEGFSKSDLILKVRKESVNRLLIAYNKKRVTEADIIKASKKAQETGLPYIILSLGEPLKKTTNLIEALKNLTGIEKVE